MQHLKVLVSASLITAALLAAIGASSAQATVLCSTTSTPCGSSWHVSTVHGTTDFGVTITLRWISEKITCTSTFHHVTSTTGSSTTTRTGTVETSSLTWSNCTSTMNTLEGGTLEYHHISGTDNATVTARGFKITGVFAGISCVYGAGTGVHFGTLTGGTKPKLDVTASLLKLEGSFLCASSATLETEYSITSSAIYAEPS